MRGNERNKQQVI